MDLHLPLRVQLCRGVQQ
ncbi:hypothetical protein E2C01_101796 [Portunus trituberculatus]|uniref:Uncharacterized protein n=1 Tax=Portunus trituberculatus TaxID=210409 RepID=A0A5B7KGX7_PORTR|nr:hypothetical protein [Portunus trituberculatus]